VLVVPHRFVRSGRASHAALLLIGSCAGAFVAPRGAAEDREFEPQIQGIEFVGNEVFDDGALRGQMILQVPGNAHPFRTPPRYQHNVFPKELRRIEAFYRRQGFGGAAVWLDSLIAVPVSTHTRGSRARRRPARLSVRVGVREGPRTFLRDIQYSPQRVFSLEELRRATPIQKGQPFPYSGAQRGRYTRALRIAFLARGHLAVAVRDSVMLASDSTEAVLVFALQPGPLFRVDSVTVHGHDKIKEPLIRRELTIAHGQVYSYTRLKESEENLYGTSWFRRVTLREQNINVEKQTVDIAVQVTERQLQFVEGAVGLARREDFEARVTGGWGHRNARWGHSIEVRGTVAYNLEQRKDNLYADARLHYVNPHWFGWNTRFEPQFAVSVDKRIEDAQLTRWRLDLPAVRRGGRFTTVSGGLFISSTDTQLETISDEARGTRGIGAAIRRNSSDNIFDPRSGDLRSLGGQRAGFGGDNHFTRFTASFARYVPVGRSVLAFGARAGWVEAFGKSRESGDEIGIRGVPFEFLFQGGGNTTVRGFASNSLGAPVTATIIGDDPSESTVTQTDARAGTVLLIANVELRFSMGLLSRLNLGGVVFADAGNVWTDVDEMSHAAFGPRLNHDHRRPDMRYSCGFGLRYRTPFGPLRADLALPLKREGRRRYHFGIGHTF
jgi:outer membrane protein insertion porin family